MANVSLFNDVNAQLPCEIVTKYKLEMMGQRVHVPDDEEVRLSLDVARLSMHSDSTAPTTLPASSNAPYCTRLSIATWETTIIYIYNLTISQSFKSSFANTPPRGPCSSSPFRHSLGPAQALTKPRTNVVASMGLMNLSSSSTK
jgi:hypothetical protein